MINLKGDLYHFIVIHKVKCIIRIFINVCVYSSDYIYFHIIDRDSEYQKNKKFTEQIPHKRDNSGDPRREMIPHALICC